MLNKQNYKLQNKILFLVSIVTLIISIFVLSNALVLECEYKILCQWTVCDLYYCDQGRIIFVGDPNNVTEVTLNHVGGRRNEDVEGLYMKHDQNLTFLPRNIHHFFPNLKAIAVNHNLIENIQQSDISVFPELIQLGFWRNRISSIDFNLFQKNPKLKAIGFSENPVQHIGYDVFDHLTELETIGFHSTCHNIKIEGNRTQVLSELPNLAQNCPPKIDMKTIDMLERQILGGEHFDQQIAEKISPLTKEISQLRQELTQLRQESTQIDNLAKIVLKIEEKH
ncbi:CLUMA_CG007336, isoform A, partial [Clunio marinus]